MQGPAVVVVEGALGAVGVPTPSCVPPLDPLQAALDRGARGLLLYARVGEKTADGEGEEPPVVVDRGLTQHAGQPCGGTLSHVVVQPVPQPRLRQPQSERDGCRLHPGLAALGRQGPGVRVVAAGGTGARGEAVRVLLQDAVRVVARGSGDAEGGEQEGARIAFEAVGARPRPTVPAGQQDESAARRRVAVDRGEQSVRRGLPVGAGPAGVRACRAVLGRKRPGDGVGLHGAPPVGREGEGRPPPYRSVRRRCTGTGQTTVSGQQSRVVELVPV